MEAVLVCANADYAAEPISFVTNAGKNMIVLKDREPFGHWLIDNDTIGMVWNHRGYAENEQMLRKTVYQRVTGTPVWQSTHKGKSARYSTFLIFSDSTSAERMDSPMVIFANFDFRPRTFVLTRNQSIMVNGERPHGYWNKRHHEVHFYWHYTGLSKENLKSSWCHKVATVATTEVYQSPLRQ